MKTVPMLLSLGLLLGLAGNAAAQSTQSHKLGWLQGCWAVVNQGRAIEEQWMAPRGKTMLGSSRTVEGSNLVGYEFMMIREQGDKYAIEVRPRASRRSSSPRRPSPTRASSSRTRSTAIRRRSAIAATATTRSRPGSRAAATASPTASSSRTGRSSAPAAPERRRAGALAGDPLAALGGSLFPP